MRCAACGGTAHPATGCQYTATCIVCGPCTRRFWAWAAPHTQMKKAVGDRKRRPKVVVSFYECATKRVGEAA